MDKKEKALPTESKDQKQKKGSTLLVDLFYFFWRSIFPTEMLTLNRCLIKANEMVPNKYFNRLLFKNRIIIMIAAGPSLINLFLLYTYFTNQNLVTHTLGSIYATFNEAIRVKNLNLLSGISVPMDFWIYLMALLFQCFVLTSASFLLMMIVKRLDPVLRDSIQLREFCRSHNYSSNDDNMFLVCKAGVLARISLSSGDDFVKDKHLWRQLNKIPKDPIESSKDRNIVFVGNGFQLGRYEFKI